MKTAIFAAILGLDQHYGCRSAAFGVDIGHDDLSHRSGRWPEPVLPRGRAEGCADLAAAARVPVIVADVRNADPAAGGSLPSRGARLSGIWLERRAAAVAIRLYVRSHRNDGRSLHRRFGAEALQRLSAGLWRSGWLSARRGAPRSHPGVRHPECGGERRRFGAGMGRTQSLLAGPCRQRAQGDFEFPLVRNHQTASRRP